MPQQPASRSVDVHVANVARMYDYFLGGKDNFPADRAAAEQVLDVLPDVRQAVRANRLFLGRAVEQMAAEGVEQFIDFGSGLPTRGSVHEIAQEVLPQARVVYVDNDPVVLAHARALLSDAPTVAAIEADLRDPRSILDHAQVRALIDFDRPVGLLLIAILHFVEGQHLVKEIVTTLRDAVPSGSFLAITHFLRPDDASTPDQVAAVYQRANASIHARTRAELEELFEGFELLPPGLTHDWRGIAAEAEVGAAGQFGVAGLGRKP